MEEQQYMSKEQKEKIVVLAMILCAVYAFFSRWRDSQDLELLKTIKGKEVEEVVAQYEKIQPYRTPVVKEVVQLENGDVLLVIGENEDMIKQELQVYSAFLETIKTQVKK